MALSSTPLRSPNPRKTVDFLAFLLRAASWGCIAIDDLVVSHVVGCGGPFRLAEETAKGKLTAAGIKHLAPGMHGDGAGLWLQVAAQESLFRYQRHSKARAMGSGGFPAVSSADARDKAEAARK